MFAQQNAKVLGFLLIFTCSCQSVFATYRVVVKNDGPIVKGGTINLNVTVYDDDSIATGSFDYTWYDNAIPRHQNKIDKGNAIESWTITYNSLYVQGSYTVRVIVCHRWYFDICTSEFSGGTTFQITETLNGEIGLIQKNETRPTSFVSNADPVLHKVELKKSDENVVQKATTIRSYWFVDCVYYGITNGLEFPFNYSKPEEQHFVEALVMADFTPLPPSTTVAPSTTTTKSTTTTTKPSTTTLPTNVTTTTKSPTAVTSIIRSTTESHQNLAGSTAKNITKRSVNMQNNGTDNVSKIMVKVNGSLVPYNGSFPFVCNSTFIASDDNKTYGYFFKRIVVKEPVSKVNITGNNWLRQGELLSLNFKCKGSQKLQYCILFKRGLYNVTGNETCETYDDLETCDYSYKRYIADEHSTVIIVIKNDVGKVVTPVAITVYKVKIQAQLSVIVVPVAFSIIAVILMVFGVAYYVQHRSRFTVEVADFDFGQQYNDMEYKTFKERLKDSITNGFTREPSPSNSEAPTWPPGHKYGSMT